MPYYNATKVPPCPGMLYISGLFGLEFLLTISKARLHLSHYLHFLDRVCNDFAALGYLRLHILAKIMTSSAGWTDNFGPRSLDDSTMPIALTSPRKRIGRQIERTRSCYPAWLLQDWMP
jgi:hypothetical protein